MIEIASSESGLFSVHINDIFYVSEKMSDIIKEIGEDLDQFELVDACKYGSSDIQYTIYKAEA